ncbi:MAG: TonB-dependent receptor, partial [Acidobacteriota bacterium]
MHPTIKFLVSWALGISMFCVAAPIWAQSGGATTANITGQVVDEQQATINGALVTIKNLNTNQSREFRTIENGLYLLVQLPPGSYDLTVSAEGFVTQTRRIDLELGTNMRFDFTMKVGVASEIVEVIGSSMINEGKTESSTNITRDRIDTLPINRRSFLDFSLTAARVTMDRGPAQGASATSGLSFNGQNARFNNITIDGLDNNDLGSGSVRSTFSQDAVQEFQVVSDNFSVEFGRAAGGIVNIVTRGGSNEYHGNLFFFIRNDESSARDVFTPFKPPYEQYQFGNTLSGAIKKDKIFFFTSFERLSVKQNNFVTISDQSVAAANRQGFVLRNGPVAFSLGNTAVLGRLDTQISPNDTLWIRYNFGGAYNGALEPFGGLVGETNGGIQKLDDSTIAFSNTYLNTGLNLINETRFLYTRRNQDVLPLDPGPLVRLVAPEGLISFGRSPLLPQLRQQNIFHLVDNVTLTRGRHQFKFGGDLLIARGPTRKTQIPIFFGGVSIFIPLDFSALTGIPGLPSFSGLEAFDPALRTQTQRDFLSTLAILLPSMFPQFPRGVPLANLALPLAFVQGFGSPNLEIDAKYLGLFFQDDIKLRPNLLLKAGLRYDFERLKFYRNNNGNFSPRISLAYRPTRLPRLNLHAGYGIFFAAPLVGPPFVVQLTDSGATKIPVLPFPFSVLPFAQPGHNFPESTQLPSTIDFRPQLSQNLVFPKRVRNSYTEQVNVGFDYLIGNNMALSASYQFVRGIKLFSVRNINPVVRPNPSNPVMAALTGRADPTRGDLFEFESAFDSYYNAVTVSLMRRLSNRFGFLVSYTFSKSIDDFIDFRIEFQETVNPLRPRDERGFSLQDVRNRFVFSGVWDLSYTRNPLLRDYQISSIVTLESGHPYNLLTGVDLNMNGDFPPGDRPLIGGVPIARNAGLLPGFANVDLRLTRSVNIGEQVRVQGFVEVFNLFNRVNISEINRIFPPDARGGFSLPMQKDGRFVASRDRYRNAFSPRQLQFG